MKVGDISLSVALMHTGGMAKKPLWRLLREKRGMTRADLAERLDVTERTIARLELETDRLSSDWIDKLSKVFGTDPTALFLPTPLSHQVPVIGRAAAGEWLDALEWDDALRYSVAVPLTERVLRAEPYGVEVIGDSMDLVYPPGSVVIVARLSRLGETAQPNRIYLVERVRGGLYEYTIKRLQQKGDVFWLVPMSSNPEHRPFRLDDVDSDEVRLRARVVASIRME